jgi:hypothetical protein
MASADYSENDDSGQGKKIKADEGETWEPKQIADGRMGPASLEFVGRVATGTGWHVHKVWR